MLRDINLSQDYDALANECAGNWKEFQSFGWHDKPEDADNFCIVYTHNRDSGLCEESNAAAIEKELGIPEFEDDITWESHNHWAVGYVDGFAVRCIGADGHATPAFRCVVDMARSLEDYPLLDETDHSKREYEATLENIRNEGNRFLKEDEQVEKELLVLIDDAEKYVAALKQVRLFSSEELPVLVDRGEWFGRAVPKDWTGELFDWFWNHNQSAVESRDDQGGFPSDEELQEAITSLGWLSDDYKDIDDNE